MKSIQFPRHRKQTISVTEIDEPNRNMNRSTPNLSSPFNVAESKITRTIFQYRIAFSEGHFPSESTNRYFDFETEFEYRNSMGSDRKLKTLYVNE